MRNLRGRIEFLHELISPDFVPADNRSTVQDYRLIIAGLLRMDLDAPEVEDPHFAPVELWAEYWHEKAMLNCDPERAAVLERFAKLPHTDFTEES